MRVIVQRSLQSSVSVNKEIVGQINNGLVLLVGFTDGDSEKTIDRVVNKILKLRIFDDEDGVMNKSILDVGGSILSISQFTLYGDVKRGNRPSYVKAMNGEDALVLYDLFNTKLKEYIDVQTGKFGANMNVLITNDGPVTIIIESEDL